MQSCLLIILGETDCHLLELKINLYAVIPLIHPLEKSLHHQELCEHNSTRLHEDTWGYRNFYAFMILFVAASGEII